MFEITKRGLGVYKKDNGTAKEFDVAIANTSDAFTTLALKPNVSSEENNGRSFQILFYGAIHSSFVLNDINNKNLKINNDFKHQFILNLQYQNY